MTTSPTGLETDLGSTAPAPAVPTPGRPSTGSKLRDTFSYWGWRVAVAGALSQMLIAGMVQHAYTHYSVLLREEFGWSATVIALGFSMNRLESGLLGPIQGWMVDRFGPRAVMRVGAVVAWGGLLAFSTVQNVFQFFLYFFIVAVGSSLAGFLTVVTAVVGWFERKRSVALAVAQAGFPIGGILVPLVVYSLTNWGWRTTSFATGWIVLVAVLALAQVMHGSPETRGQEIDGGPPPDDDRLAAKRGRSYDGGGPERDFTLHEALRTRAFWMLNLGHATALLVVGSTMAHLSIYLTEEQDFTLTQAGFLGTALMLTQLVGQMTGGWLGDRHSKQRLVTMAMGGHLVGMALFTYASAPWMIWAFVPFHGLAWGIRGPLLQAIRADYFGTSSFGRIMGWSSLIMMTGTMSGPIIVGVLRDTTGTYTLGFTVVTIGASLAIGFFLLASRPAVPTTTR